MLIVDDESQMLGELQEALSDYGFTVRSASSGAMALNLLASRPEIDVLISDIRMPEMDGFELTRRVLAQRADLEAVEVILITGHASLDDAVAAIHTGAFDFVRKPFKIANIVAACRTAMARSIGRRAIAARINLPESIAVAPDAGQSAEDLMVEVREPLIPIIGFADMLQRGLTDIETCATEIRQNALAVVSSVDSFGRLTRAARADEIMDRRVQTVGPLLEAAIAWGQPSAKARASRIVLSGGGEIKVAVDGDMIGTAVRLLLQLVIRLMPSGTVVDLSAVTDDGQVLIRINGQMPNRVPMPAHSMSCALAEASRILPLGMTLLQRMVELHQGSFTLIWAERQTAEATLQLPQF